MKAESPSDEAALDYIATRIAPKFGVPTEVIAERLQLRNYARLNESISKLATTANRPHHGCDLSIS